MENEIQILEKHLERSNLSMDELIRRNVLPCFCNAMKEFKKEDLNVKDYFTDNEIISLIFKIDNYATRHNQGLPIHDYHLENLTNIIKKFLNKKIR